MSEPLELLTVGYGRWPAHVRGPRLVEALKRACVELLVDIRHSPCASNLDPAHHYGPRDWHLQSAGSGIVTLLRGAGMEYRWLVELGNPQKTAPGMEVLPHVRLREVRGMPPEGRRGGIPGPNCATRGGAS